MYNARGFGLNGNKLYSNVAKPTEVNLAFTVDATNGLGVTSVKSNGFVRNVFMHTSTTPAANNGYTNPNPANGYLLVQLYNNLNNYLGHYASIQAPNSGSAVKIDNSALVVGQAYTITVLGDATLAKWQAIGVPVGVTPAVGVSFIATSNGGAGNVLTSRVQAPSVSGVAGLELVGNPNLSVSSTPAANGGEWLLMQFLAPSFTGSALGNHTHNLLIVGGQAASTTNNIAAYAGPILGKEEAANATILGADSATNGGVVAASAGTPAGTISFAAAAPAAGSIVSMRMYFDGSSVTVDGL